MASIKAKPRMLSLMDELEETYVEEAPHIDFEIKEVDETTSSCLDNCTPTFDEPDVPKLKMGSKARQESMINECYTPASIFKQKNNGLRKRIQSDSSEELVQPVNPFTQVLNQ